jgi:hypothetical protein
MRLRAGVLAGLATVLVMATATAAQARPLDACKPVAYAVNNVASTCGVQTAVAGKTVAADCRHEYPATLPPPPTFTTTDGCAATVGAQTVNVGRCTDDNEWSYGHSAATGTCRTGVNRFGVVCERHRSTDSDFHYSSHRTERCATATGPADGLAGHSCEYDVHEGWSTNSRTASCTQRVGVGSNGASHTCAEQLSQEYSDPATYEDGCTTTAGAAGTSVSCTSDPVVEPITIADYEYTLNGYREPQIDTEADQPACSTP